MRLIYAGLAIAAALFFAPLVLAVDAVPALTAAVATDPVTITPEFIQALLVHLGPTGATIATVFGIATAIWVQVRPHIPNAWMVALPWWLLILLEWWAGNRGNAANDSTMGAAAIKTRSEL